MLSPFVLCARLRGAVAALNRSSQAEVPLYIRRCYAAPMRRLAFVALIFAGVCWGLGFPLGKLALREMEAAHMVLLRMAFAAAAALPFALARPEARALFRSPTVLLAGVLYGAAFLIQFEGLARITVTLAALMVGLMPALIAVLGRFMGERASRLTWAGVIAATFGAAFIAGKPDAAGSPVGVVLSLLALLIFLAWLVVVRGAPKALGMSVPSVVVVVAAVVLLPIASIMHGPPPLSLSPAAWASVALQGVASTFLATAAWQFGMGTVGATAAGVFINIEPLMGSAIGVGLFGDVLTASMAIGGALIIAGSFAVVLGERGAAPSDLKPVTPA
jgi:drug/metabolite transporter (DMT)-like permease